MDLLASFSSAVLASVARMAIGIGAAWRPFRGSKTAIWLCQKEPHCPLPGLDCIGDALLLFSSLWVQGRRSGDEWLERSGWKIGNVDTKLFKKLLIPGIVGAILGALVITKVKIPYLSIVISIYLFFMGIFLIAKAYSKIKLQFKQKNSAVIPLAVTGGFVDGAGGGGSS